MVKRNMKPGPQESSILIKPLDIGVFLALYQVGIHVNFVFACYVRFFYMDNCLIV